MRTLSAIAPGLVDVDVSGCVGRVQVTALEQAARCELQRQVRAAGAQQEASRAAAMQWTTQPTPAVCALCYLRPLVMLSLFRRQRHLPAVALPPSVALAATCPVKRVSVWEALHVHGSVCSHAPADAVTTALHEDHSETGQITGLAWCPAVPGTLARHQISHSVWPHCIDLRRWL